MKVIKKEYKVYNFDELSDDIKDSVIEKYYENEDYPFLEEDIKQEIEGLDNCFSGVTLHYSLSYCQGDGLSFEGVLDLRKFLDTKYSKKIHKYKKNAICEYIWKVHSKGNDGHYCYASENDIDYDYNYPGEVFERIDILFLDVLKEIKEYY